MIIAINTSHPLESLTNLVSESFKYIRNTATVKVSIKDWKNYLQSNNLLTKGLNLNKGAYITILKEQINAIYMMGRVVIKTKAYRSFYMYATYMKYFPN